MQMLYIADKYLQHIVGGSQMRLVIEEFRHIGIQFSLIVLLTMVYFLLIRLVT
jgi:hypothetical protein